MKVALIDIQEKFEALTRGVKSRETVADYAARAMKVDDAGLLEMEQAFSEKIWEAILYLSGVDLKDEPDQYLHTIDDFLKAREDLGV